MKYLFLLPFLLLFFTLPAQDVGGFFSEISQRISDRDFLRLQGSLGVNAGLNFFADGGSGAARRNQPFNWRANASLQLDFLGVKAPFTAAFANRNTLYKLPSYSFYGLSPAYKWITLHAGDRNLSFSPYSLSGINFRGGGLELKPGKFYLAAMRGRLRQARIQDAGSLQEGEGSGKRQAQGVKIGYDNQQGSTLAVSLFSSADEFSTESLTDTIAGPDPERNLVLAVSMKQKISKFLQLDAEWGHSILSRDDTAPFLSSNIEGPRLLGLFKPRTTTSAANALKLRFSLSPKFGKIRLSYERIAPEYQTHGALFFQNDLENITGGTSFAILDKKLTVSLESGLQRNDLASQSLTRNRRFIGSADLNYAASQRLNFGLNISNFTTTNRYKAIARTNLFVDSVVIAQTQQSLTGNTSILLDDAGEQSLIFSGSYQRAAIVRDNRTLDNQTNNFSFFMFSYARQRENAAGGFSASLLLHRNLGADVSTTTFGPGLTYSHQLLAKKLLLGANLSGQLVSARVVLPAGGDSRSQSTVIEASLTGRYKMTEKQALNLSLLSLIATDGSDERPGYRSFQLQAGWRFSW